MERKTYLDIAKGLAMICIFLGHLGINMIDRVVYTFMVSVFFIITGYFVNTKRDIKTFILDKFKRLVIPYVIVSVAIILLSVIVNELFAEGVNSKGIAFQWMIAALFGTGASDITFLGYPIPGIGAIWFLLATFFGIVALRILLEVKPMMRVLFVFLILYISYQSTSIIFLPWSLQPAGVALFFMYVGYLWKQTEIHIEKLSKEFIALITVISIWCWLEAVIDYQWFLLVLALVGRGMTDILRSICGCYVVFLVAKILDKNKISRRLFSFVGQYSIIFLSVHLLELIFLPKNEIQYAFINFGISETISFWLVVLLRFIIIMLSVALLLKWNITRKFFGFSIIKKGEKT